MYFGIGGHPGFNVPLDPSKQFTDYRLRFGAPAKPRSVGLTPACFLDGTDSAFELENDTILPLAHNLFDHDAIVLKEMAREVTIEAADGPSVTVRFPGMPYLGIWHAPRTDAPYVCIEPWCGLPAFDQTIEDLATKPDMFRICPNSKKSVQFSIEFE
jgi:galactose mutarotase-like enzyme